VVDQINTTPMKAAGRGMLFLLVRHAVTNKRWDFQIPHTTFCTELLRNNQTIANKKRPQFELRPLVIQ